jgi:hypothetical protein
MKTCEPRWPPTKEKTPTPGDDLDLIHPLDRELCPSLDNSLGPGSNFTPAEEIRLIGSGQLPLNRYHSVHGLSRLKDDGCVPTEDQLS